MVAASAVHPAPPLPSFVKKDRREKPAAASFGFEPEVGVDVWIEIRAEAPSTSARAVAAITELLM
jgi:hypothetical protein